jgi:ubiquinone/menaquinone biosynthesis C-methylase UbiE
MSRVTDYDSISSQFDRRYQGQEYPGIKQTLATFIGDNREVDVLEVGCGTGYWLRVLREQAGFVVGIDLSTNMLQHARSATPDALLVRGRAEALPYQSQCFDRLLCLNAFHHFAEKAKFLTETRRVLRHYGGLMIVGLDPHTRLDRWWVYDYFPETVELDRQRYPSTEEMRTTMSRLGFLRCETMVAEHLTLQIPARSAIERGLLARSYTSQLTILSTREYQEGMARVTQALDAANVTGEELICVGDLRLYATMGWVDR